MHFDEKTPHVLSSSKNSYGSKTAVLVAFDMMSYLLAKIHMVAKPQTYYIT